jgi:hypothetical protein
MVAGLSGGVPGGAAGINAVAAGHMGRRPSDQWVQRRTDEPVGYWPDPAWERIRRPGAGLEPPLTLARDCVAAHARRGDTLHWQERTPHPQARSAGPGSAVRGVGAADPAADPAPDPAPDPAADRVSAGAGPPPWPSR